MNHAPSKHFSTSARVHPSYLPYMHTSKAAKGAKWIPPAVALAAAGYGVSAYRQAQMERHLAAAEQDAAAERRRRQAAAVLDDAYGDRSSLEGLERAMRVYEAQQSQQ
ncbi:hypothetical protein CONLIGDRAFT_641499 [Coniochaeta ligniaria NRRL 30616]|uniref:Uncharacterized protein n=1 Tax=Coniochaeta ligniaria NRRL 30616 TaxID=1408157 RepID=A0A1J7JVE3_9PEZI|nr:hypothetical protein CONLIGDRAFT_641499 [Coniochaeta ligniaria NRRL 30616]